MATTITIDTREIAQLAKSLNGLSPALTRENGVAMKRASILVQNDARVAVKVDTGRLRASITTDVTPTVGKVGSNLRYAEVVEKGRAAGRPMPPSGALVGWMRRHGIPVEAEFVIRRAIGKRGIRAHPYLIPALSRNRGNINREFKLAADRALKQLAT